MSAPPATPSDEALASLVADALAAQATAYAPYSNYHVGSAVLASDGRVFRGANIENASYGLTVCAERNAVAAAVLAGARRITAVAVLTASSPPAAPCGICRQTLAEFASDDCLIVMRNGHGEERRMTLGDLLPQAFRSEALQ